MSKEKLFSEFPPVSTEQWEAAITADLKGADYEKKLVWQTPDGFKVKPYYREEDLKNLSYLQSAPGEFPFVRGSKTQNNDWEVRQEICEDELSKINAMARDAVSRGVQGLGLRATKVTTPADLKTMLNGIDLTKTQIHFTKSPNYGGLLMNFVAYLNENKIDATQVRGSVNFDFLAYSLQHGDFYASLDANIAEAKALFTAFSQKLPNFRLMSVNAQLLHNAGATATQELGFGLAWAAEYVFRLTEAGVPIDTITPRITLHFAVGSNYFIEMAKIRAARMLWSLVLDKFHATNTRAFIHVSTSTWNKSIYDPNVNMLRTTTEAMSAVLGGADSLYVDAYDTTFKCADDFSARIARNQQIILKEESYMDKIIDPAAGSYYIENLTDSVAQFAWKNFQTVEEKGGFLETFKSGFVQDEVMATAQQRIKDLGNRKIVMLGTNQYPNGKETMQEKIQTKCCASCHEKRGEYKQLLPIHMADSFNEIRLATEKAMAAGKKCPAVFLLTFGNLAMRKARAGFAQNFFACAGYQIIDNAGFKTAEEGIQAALASKAEIVVFCSSDEEYLDMAPALCQGLKGKAALVVAGYPKEAVEALNAAGVEDYIHVKVNVVDALTRYQKKLGLL